MAAIPPWDRDRMMGTEFLYTVHLSVWGFRVVDYLLICGSGCLFVTMRVSVLSVVAALVGLTGATSFRRRDDNTTVPDNSTTVVGPSHPQGPLRANLTDIATIGFATQNGGQVTFLPSQS